MTSPAASSGGAPPLAADARVWLRIGWLSFGGPAGQIALMQRLLVEDLRWISLERFLAGLDLCMLLPGPEAQQLAAYVGWTRQGWRGGLVAGGLFVLPGALVMFALSWLYVTWGALPTVVALFSGLQCAVVAIVAQALLRVGRKALPSAGAWGLAAAAFVALSLFRAPFVAVVAAGALAGLLLGSAENGADPWRDTPAPSDPRPSWWAAAIVAALWAVPLAALVLALGAEHLLARIALRFGELALVSFGGAYALLAAIAERAVGDGWLSAAQMTDGLALAETTPGPLILVLQFVAFVTARGAGSLGLAFLAGTVALWALFLPSFVWIFAAAPHLDRLQRRPALRRALRGVSAVVVGVILHLSVWLAVHVLFAQVDRHRWGALEASLPRWDSLDPWSLAITALCAALLFGARQPMGRVLILAALLGLARNAIA